MVGFIQSVGLQSFTPPSKLAAAIVLMLCATIGRAQPRVTWAVEGNTEVGWNMSDGRAVWVNLLSAGIDVGLWKGAHLEGEAISTYTTNKNVSDNLLGFSNIYTPTNKAFRLIQASLGQHFGQWAYVSVGLRNIDYDYFTSAYTSFFTGSSYGNFPTLSLNHPLPTYPLSALGLHIEYSPTENIVIKESLYTGSASDRFDRQFRIRPASDGFFNIGSISYTAHGNGYSPASYTFNYSVAKMPEGKGKKKIHYALFGNIEQPVATIRNTGIGMLLQGSWSPTHGQEMCRGYAAMAIVAERQNGLMAGIAANRVFTLEGNETDLEFTVGLPLLKYFTLTPSLHCIFTEGNSCNVVGMLRLSFAIGQ